MLKYKSLLAARFLLASCLWSSCSSVDEAPGGEDAGTLRALARQRGIEIGAAVNTGPLTSDAEYQRVLAREFSMVTAENAMKFGPLRPSLTTFSWTEADRLVEFARRNDMAIRGHALVWHQQNSFWLTNGNWTRDQLIEIMRQHIHEVVGRYKDDIAAWDVVNEAVSDGGDQPLRESIWKQIIGDDYIDLAFQFAREADPDARLFYNDYGAEGLGPKSDRVYALVKGLKDRGVPIDGVGFQMHLSTQNPLSPSYVADNMQRLHQLGLEVQITEMDVRMPVPADDSAPSGALLAQQAGIYEGMMNVCLAASNCSAFVLWGFTDRYSWVPQQFPGQGAALIFDESIEPKPAYRGLLDALKQSE